MTEKWLSGQRQKYGPHNAVGEGLDTGGSGNADNALPAFQAEQERVAHAAPL